MENHAPHFLVLTGGPGAGKTAVLEMVRKNFCSHVQVLPESAGILFKGGFPRFPGRVPLESAQRAIAAVQRELETMARADPRGGLVVCDRGIMDGLAYWPGEPETFWKGIGQVEAEVLARYATVVHLRTPRDEALYDRSSAIRRESPEEAVAIDERIAEIWRRHPRVFTVDGTATFLEKVERALDIIRREVPACCREAGKDSSPENGLSPIMKA